MKCNVVTLTGNTGGEARIVETGEKTFAALSLATTDTYQDDAGNWQSKEAVWHNVIAFNPVLVEALKSFKKGVRLQITGELSYRPFEVQLPDGQTVTKWEASIIARKVEQAPLVKKTAGEEPEAA
jgi:single-stranded DNA-binding protein